MIAINRFLLLVLMSASLISTSRGESGPVNLNLPTLRIAIYNPEFIDDQCRQREFLVKHRRGADGRPFAIKVFPLNGAEESLIPLVVDAFSEWEFLVPEPIFEEQRAEYLSAEHENKVWTEPHCDCEPTCDKRY